MVLPLRGAERYFSHITSSDNSLISDVVRVLHQDSHGFIWIGTACGVSRYDGTRIVNFSGEDMGLTSSYVASIEEDSKGNIWVSTSSGVSKYDYADATFKPLNIASENGIMITHLANTMLSRGKYMWMSVNQQGLFKYDIEEDKMYHFPLMIRRFVFDDEDRLWASSYYNNLLFSNDTFKSIGKAPLGVNTDYFKDDQIQMMQFSQLDPEILYIASLVKGFSKVNIKTGVIKQLYEFPKNSNLNSAFLEKEDRLWASTSNGLFCYNLHTDRVEEIYCTDDVFSLSSNYVFAAIVDREGGLWVGTKDGGVDYSNPNQERFKAITRSIDGKSLNGLMISGFAEAKDGKIWVTTEQGGLFIYDKKNGLRNIENDALPKTLISPVVDGEELWIGSLEGVFRMNTNSGKVKAYGPLLATNGIYDPRVYNILRTSSGEIYATSTRSLSRYYSDKDRFLPIPAAGPHFFTDVVEANDGSLWLSSFYSGLENYNPTEGKVSAYYSRREGIPDDQITSVLVDRTGIVWIIGFSNGFARLDPSSGDIDLKNKGNIESIDSDIFYQAIEDDQGRLWLSSDDGLVLYNPHTCITKVVFRQKDGLLDFKFTNSALSCSDGEMLFGCNNGFIVVNPYLPNYTSEAPKITITEIKIEGDLVPGNANSLSKLSLSRGNGSFSMLVSSPGYYSSSAKLIQYLLEGHIDKWSALPSSGELMFFNLAPGDYKLRFRSQDSRGEWHECHREVIIKVPKPFYATIGGALALIGILILVVTVVTLLNNVHNKKKRKQQVIAYKKKKDEELFYEKMNFFSHVVHEIKTPLTLIKTPLEEVLEDDTIEDKVRHDLEVVSSNTDYLSNLINELLEFVRVEKKGYILTKVPINLSDRVQLLLFNYSETATSKGVNIELTSQEDEPIWISADSFALNKILNNLILNAIKYSKSYVKIHLSSDSAMASLRISNDGNTIPPEHREEIFRPFVRHSNSENGFGIGLPLALSLARMHFGSLSIEDGEETCFLLNLPCIKDNIQIGRKEDIEVASEHSRPTIMVVDDNAGLCAFLSEKLSETYDVVTCYDAESAFKLMDESNIDLVITDIIMTGMDGLELCRVIRANIEISHIPIIVLSARGSVESKINAMEAGADLYVEKPFNMDYLRASVANILDRRMLMKKALSSGPEHTDFKVFGLPERDEAFLRKLNELIEINLSSSELTNSFLASNLAMSEATLIRKIRKMMDTTPTNYIRDKRLNKAATLLKSGNSSLTEVAYDVGFNSLSYFSRCFKDRFGCAPSEYLAK